MTPGEKYRDLTATGALQPDPAQAAVAARLDALARNLRYWRRRSNGIAALLSRPQPPPRGLYIFGAVGRGKTMLMDLFFETTTFRHKRRAHFHEFMADVHDRIAAARKTVPGDPIPQVAAGIAEKTALLCFDEMHVTDIADAMILGRLFKALFELQVVVVATSNVHPRDLYRNGLNRQLFVPFIDLLEQNMEVEELLAAKDFRLEKLIGKPLYFTPADAHARAQMDRLWAELTGNTTAAPLTLEIKGRKLHRTCSRHGGSPFLLRGPLRTAAWNNRLPGAGAQIPHHLHRRHSRAGARAAGCGAPVRQSYRHALRQPHRPSRVGGRGA